MLHQSLIVYGYKVFLISHLCSELPTMKPVRSRSMIIFYALIAYIAVQLAWWTYLIINLLSKAHTTDGKLENKSAMVLGELAVFLVLLVLAVWQLRKTLKKELSLNKSQRNFLLSVTHELKSPVAVAKLNIQTLQKHDLDRQRELELLQNSLLELNRLENLVENILVTAGLEERGYSLHLEKLCITDILQKLVVTYRQMYRSNEFELNVQPHVHVNGDLMAMETIFSNLISNAVKYSPERAVVQINLYTESGKAVIFVIDNGIGISNEAKELIFNKFYREGNEEVRRTKGTGLGLYIVRSLVHRQGGEISVTDNRPSGSCFKVSFNSL